MRDRRWRWPASHAQQRLWFLDRIEPGSGAYNMPGAVLIEGPLDEARFGRAFERLTARHGALRTVFELDGDELYQTIGSDAPPLVCIDLRGEADPRARAAAILLADAALPFDLAAGPLVRAMLLRLAPECAVFSCNTHHSIADQWSQELLLHGLLQFYASAAEPPPAREYHEYARWQTERLAGPELAEARAYWSEHLSGTIAPLRLPTDFGRPLEMTHRGANLAFELDGELADGLEQLCRSARATPFQLLTALSKLLLYRYSGQAEIVVGTPIAGRDHVDFAAVVGNFVNTLVLRDTLDGSASFAALLASVKATTEAAYEYAGYPFDLIVRDLKVEADLGRSPLFDVAVVYQTAADARQQVDGLTVSPFDFGHASAKFDLSLYFGPTARGLRVVFNYNTDLFRPETIARMAESFAELARAVVAAPEAPLASFEVVPRRARELLADGFNATAAAYPDATIVELFEAQVERSAERVAVTTPHGELTYKELNALANRIACGLRAQFGVVPGDRVAVLMEPSASSIAALLGVLKAGAAYVPLDPIYPHERLAFILGDSTPRLLLSEGPYIGRAWDLPVADIRELRGSEENLAVPGGPADLAYIIYTSGSTGVPKGCCVEHRSVACLLRNASIPFAFDASDTWILAHSLCFDFSVWEMYGALLYGGRLVVPQRETVRDVESFWRLVREQRVSVLNQTPAAFANFIALEAAAERHDLDEHLRYVIFGGDRLEPAALRPWVAWYPAERIALVNMFGITETTVHVTFGRLSEAEIDGTPGASPIGVPLPQTQVYVLNAARRVQPIGVAGEIYVGGTGVCRGYLGRPELNAERFIENPFRPDERLFKSGDLGRWSAHGTLEHLGRNDAQVQVRGFRVEPGEIVERLLVHPHVRQAHVAAREGADRIVELVAYVVPAGALAAAELLAHLRETLPEYMVPAHVVALDELPLTANGKIDAGRLPAPEAARLTSGPVRPPRDRLERELADIWSRVLGAPVRSIDESYFNLGGDSIRVIRLVSAIAAELGCRVAVKDVFRSPTIAGLAAVVRQGGAGATGARERAERLLVERQRAIASDPGFDAIRERDECETFFPLSDVEQGMLYHSLLDPGSAVYHVQFVFEIDDDQFDERIFADALRLLVERHDILRTSYYLGSEPAHVVWRTIEMDFATIDRSTADPATEDAFLHELLAADLRRPFDPARPGLWRMRAVRLAARIAVVWTFHHAIMDGWSDATFLADLIETYLRRKREPDYAPAPLRAAYRDFIADQLLVERSASTADFWGRYLAEYEKTPLPLGKTSSPAVSRALRRKFVRRFDASLTERLLALSRAAEVPVRDVYLAAFHAWLGLVAGKEKLLFGIVGHSRPAIEDGDRIVGCCLNSVPLRYGVPGDATPRERIASTHDRLNEVREHDRLSTRRIARLAGSGHDDGNPLFDVLFNFIDFHVLERLEPGIVAGSRLLYAMENTNTLMDFSISGTFGDHRLSLFYLESLYDEAEAARLADYFTRILTQFVEAPERPLDFGAVLGEEREALLAFGTGPRHPYPRTAPVAALFDEQVQLHGDRPAIAIAGRTLSYRELQLRANAVAQALRGTYGLGRGECVAIRLPRTEWAIVAMLGILKAGGVYVPLDPESPAQRSAHIVRETGSRIVLTATERAALDIEGVSELDIVALAQQRVAGELSLPEGDGDDLAYIIYTSGSTGVPKGTLVEQRAIVRLVRNTNFITIGPEDKIAQAGSIAFDACTFEIWGALLNGACVAIVEASALVEGERFAAALRADRASVLFLTTSLFNQFAEADPSMFAGLRVLLTGGEKASPNHFNLVRSACPALEVLHVYGPTENTTFSTFYRVKHDCTDAVPIGMPIANSSAYIVDGALRLLPIGVPGEICTGGDGVARGYLGNGSTTAAAFTADPFSPGGRLYRTGDIGTWLADGSIQFLGRIDGQVKVRGFRVEPGEIEAAMHAHPAIVEAIVIPHTSAVGTIELAAYYTTRGDLAESDLRGYLASSLPAHMVPAYLHPLDAMPLALTGKIDRRALPALVEQPGAAPADATPRDERERLLAEIWCLLLGRERVGIHDDYFALGGDSIKSIQMSSRLRQAGWKLEMRALFEHPSIAALAPTLQPREPERVEEETGLPIPLTPVQRWFFASHAGKLDHFNLSLRLRAAAPVDADRLRGALQTLWEHHAALRFRFDAADAVASQVPADAGPVPFEILTADEAGGLQAELDLRAGPLFKSALVRNADGDDVLLVVHHLVADTISCRILAEDLECAYQGRAFPPKTAAFALWARGLVRFARTETCTAEARFWRNGFAGSGWSPRLDRPAGSNRYGECRSVELVFSADETRELLGRRPAGIELPSLFLTALARVLDGAGDRACAVTLEGHGREPIDGDIDVSRTVGWFTTLFPFRIELAGATAREVVEHVDASLRSVPRKGATFGIARYLAPEPDAEGPALPRVGFNYLGEFVGEPAAIFTLVDQAPGAPIDPAIERYNVLDVVGLVLQKSLRFSFTYSTEQFDAATIEALGERFRRELFTLTAALVDAAPDVRAATRPQFPGVSADELAAVLGRFQ
jgi:amino acid adenylation domain-containing protein/non-ribosomal peptide synthase protein (TIGR01720 family)